MVKCKEKIDLKINLYVYYKSDDSLTILFYLEKITKNEFKNQIFYNSLFTKIEINIMTHIIVNVMIFN